MSNERTSKELVIFLDDDEQLLAALKRVCRNGSFDFLLTTDPAEALGWVERLRPKLVVSDFQMPSMNGIEYLTRVSSIHPECKRVLLTGTPDAAGIEDAVGGGCVHEVWPKELGDGGFANRIEAKLK